jgi:hypothetical protein
MGSPITSWESAAAHFTGAHSGTSIAVFLILAIVLTVVPIWHTACQEAELDRRHRPM